MAKSRATRLTAEHHSALHRQYLGFAGGNGSHEPETDVQRLEHLEEMLVSIKATLEVQFQRMADMQVVIDRLTAERHR